MTIDASTIVVALIVALVLSVSHFLFRHDHGAERPLSPIASYTVGVGAIVAGFVALMALRGTLQPAIDLVVIVLAAGAVTIGWRYVRPMRDERNTAEELAERQRILNDIMARYSSAKDTK